MKYFQLGIIIKLFQYMRCLWSIDKNLDQQAAFQRYKLWYSL